MPAITVQDVVNEASDLLTTYAATPEGQAYIASRIVVAEAQVDAETFGAALYPHALALLAAHLTLTGKPSLGGMVAGNGVVQSASVGGVSVTYAASSQSARAPGPHSTTSPGAAYDSLLAGRVVSMVYL